MNYYNTKTTVFIQGKNGNSITENRKLIEDSEDIEVIGKVWTHGN